MKKETKVNCKVENCKYNDSKKCELEELDISCTSDKENCENKKETICNSFEKQDDDDNDERENEEYEEDIIDDETIEEESEEDDDEYEELLVDEEIEIIEE